MNTISVRVRRLARKFAAEFGIEVTPDELWAFFKTMSPMMRTILIYDSLANDDVCLQVVHEYCSYQVGCDND